MNCVISKPSGTGLNIAYIADPMSGWEDQYATIPMVAVQSIFRAPGEEELHTAFEQAISDRVMSVNRRLRHLSGPITAGGYAPPSTDQLIEHNRAVAASYSRAASHHTHMWQRTALILCLCVLMMTLGFDLMGVLLVYGGR
ncbi:MAG TPA: hypothetical protein VKV20_06990 [Ktedonobacteraceae bacterium]|jgi:hypothetical protein|nr:hypothetical protein [Ktedonobacteraceae bacterium]